MSRFGQYLCKRGLLTREHLQEALEHQAVYGARLGSNLVELRMITPEQLAQCLSDFHNAPLPPRPWLERPGKAAVKRVTRALVERIRFIPLRYVDKVLHVAVLDPNDPGVLDNLRFATGCRIKSYVMPETWIHDWLFTLFQIPRGIRHIEVDYGPAHEPPNQTPLALDLQAMQAAQQAKQSAPDRSAVHGKQPARVGPAEARASAVSVAAIEPEPVRPTESVRPPPITVRSLADLAGSASVLFGAMASASARESMADAGTSALWAPVPADPRWLSVPTLDSEPAPAPEPEPLEQYPEEYEPEYDPSLEADGELESNDPEGESLEPPPALPVIATPPPRIKPNVLTPSAFPRAETAMMEVTDRDHLIELAFSLAGCFAAHVALFVVQQGTLQGLRCAERHAPPRPLEGVLVPAGSDSMLTEVVTAQRPLRANPASRAIDQKVRELVGDAQCRQAALFPVAIKQRVVNVLYASNGDEPLGEIAFAALATLAERMGAAYEKLILSRKAG